MMGLASTTSWAMRSESSVAAVGVESSAAEAEAEAEAVEEELGILPGKILHLAVEYLLTQAFLHIPWTRQSSVVGIPVVERVRGGPALMAQEVMPKGAHPQAERVQFGLHSMLSTTW